MSRYIFLLYDIYHLCFTCIDFYDLSAWCGCWFDVYIRRFIYKDLNICGAASQAGDADSSRAPGLTSGFQGSVNVQRGTLLLVPQ